MNKMQKEGHHPTEEHEKKISNRKCVPSNWPGQCSTCRNACMPTTSPGVCADVHLLLQPGCLLPGVPAGALPPFPHAGSCASPAKETFLWRAPWPQHPTAGEEGSAASAPAKWRANRRRLAGHEPSPRTCVPEPRRGGPAPPSDLSAARSQPRLMVLPIITFIFYDVSGGPFGIEDSVRADGALPLLLLLLFLLVAEGFLVAAVAGQATRARAAARARLREGSGGSVEAAQARRLQVHIHLPRRAGDDDATTAGLDRSRRSLSFSGTVSHPYFPYRINRKSITPEKFGSVRGSRGSGPPARSHARRWYNRRTRRLMVDARSWSLVRGAWR